MRALACELPGEHGLPLARLSSREIAREAVARGICCEISGATVWRWLSEDAIRPWRYRSWIFPRDPAFREKAARVLDLYAGRFAGRRLHPADFVVCADEKPSIQARSRVHAPAPPAPGRGQLVEHEYERRGALCYLAAWDVRRARVFGRCEPRGGIEPFDRLVAQVMEQEPYRSARRVFWVVDNGSSHRGQRAVERLAARWPRRPELVLVHLPHPRQLAQPGRDLLLRRPAQGAPAERLRRPRRARRSPARLRAPLRADRHALRVDLHQARPRPAPGEGRGPARRTTPGRMTRTAPYVCELSSQTTKEP